MSAKVYFYAHGWHHLLNIEPVIRELERRGVGYKAIMFAPKDDNFGRVEQVFPRENIEVLAETGALRSREWLASLGKPGKLLDLIWSFLWLALFIGRGRPTCVAVTEDVTLGSSLITRAAKLWGIRCVHLPVENIQFAAHRMSYQLHTGRILPEHPNWLQKLAHHLYPINVQPYEGKRVYRYSPYRILASYPLGLLPGSPWIRGSNHLDRVAVNSRVQLEENARYGLDAGRQCVTGFPMHDQLIGHIRQREAIKSRMMAQLGLPGDKKVCLVVGTNPPVLWTAEQLPHAYQAHGELIATLDEELGDHYAILFKVHPWQDEAEFIQKLGGGKPAVFVKNEFSVYELLAASDLILMFKSSTVIAALALEAPVLAYGIYNLAGMPEFYNRYTSVDQVYSLDDIRRVLRTVDDPEYREDLKRRREADREQFGMFDGHNTQRMVELILGA
jgi:hypothetical protein